MKRSPIYIRAGAAISPINSFDSMPIEWHVNAQGNNYYLCTDIDYKEHIPARMLRRMSKPVRMGMTLTEHLLKELQLEKPDAVVMGTGLGLAKDTESFLNQLLEEQEQLMNPTLFIQSIHNTVGGTIALAKQCNGYNMTFVQDSVSFEAAMLDACSYLREHPEEQLLCGGFDELTPQSFLLYQRTGDWREDAPNSDQVLHHKASGRIAGEGAAAFMLSTESYSPDDVEIVDVHLEMNGESDAENMIVPFLKNNGLSIEDVDVFLMGVDGEQEGDRIYDAFIEKNEIKSVIAYKHLCGHYYAASSFALWVAYELLRKGQIPSALLYRGVVPDAFSTILVYHCSDEQKNHGLMLLRKV